MDCSRLVCFWLSYFGVGARVSCCGWFLGVRELRCGAERLSQDVADSGGWLVDAEHGGEGGGEIDGLDAAAVGSGKKGRAVEAERHVAVVGVGREVGGAGG